MQKNMNVKYDNIEIGSKSEVKYLGAMVNQDMPGQSMGIIDQ